MKRTQTQLVAQLQREGLVFSEFSLFNQGRYSVSDADWNYKDVPHLKYVHALVESVIGLVDDDNAATINLQKILGFTFPMTVFNYQSSPTTQTYFTCLLVFALVIETNYEPISPNETRVKTTYCIGSSKWWRWVHPLIRWLISKNYNDLMSQDIPMRTRRGQLRDWGYAFRNNKTRYSFEDTMDITVPNVIFPEQSPAFADVTISLKSQLPQPGSEHFIGRDDHLGLRVVRSDEETLSIFPRLCPHEGSSLDSRPCSHNRVRCHWHGRLFAPLTMLKINSAAPQTVNLEYHTITLMSDQLTVQAKKNVSDAIV